MRWRHAGAAGERELAKPAAEAGLHRGAPRCSRSRRVHSRPPRLRAEGRRASSVPPIRITAFFPLFFLFPSSTSGADQRRSHSHITTASRRGAPLICPGDEGEAGREGSRSGSTPLLPRSVGRNDKKMKRKERKMKGVSRQGARASVTLRNPIHGDRSGTAAGLRLRQEVRRFQRSSVWKASRSVRKAGEVQLLGAGRAGGYRRRLEGRWGGGSIGIQEVWL
ncbi:hypothetical protein FQA47_014364 [Oryzias melastigma]|uniref:Uncharacterized protein n=1 Tax=Oryzias melastigma TaxID=30732 RepID=A0A834CFJ4_ORYME|nr:hypothetical protein FQA47_014364 [Oryzias melastigma]